MKNTHNKSLHWIFTPLRCVKTSEFNRSVLKNMKKNNYRLRILLSILFVLIALCSFILPPAPETVTIKISDTKSISTTHDYGSKIFEWVGFLFLAFSVWPWRRELKLTGFGPLAGEPLTQQTPNDFRASENDTEIEETIIAKDTTTITKQRELEEFEAKKQAILELLEKRHSINVALVANELRVTSHTAKDLLYLLVKEGKVRCDGFPRHSLYTLTASVENLAIDHIRDLIELDNKIEKERRFVRVKQRFEVDAVFETRNAKVLVEVKFLRSIINPSRLNEWINRFHSVSREFKAERIICYLALVVFESNLLESTQKQVSERITYDTGDFETRILVLSKEELEKQSQNKRIE